jgi:hypothetical protein
VSAKTSTGASAKKPPGPPGTGMSGSAEIQAWIARLEAQNKTIGRRNVYLGMLLILGLLLLLFIFWWLYQSGVRSYAVLENVQILRHPASQGRIQIRFRVVTPGKVYFYRSSGNIETEVIDYFNVASDQERNWSWVYEPGQEIDVSMLYRGALWRRSQQQAFPTANRADIVILMDTTGSMSRSIATLKEKCVDFSAALKQKQLEHRFALIGFGDTYEGEWSDKYDFTEDVGRFKEYVGSVRRFDGGDLPESSLDALEMALSLPMGSNATRRFYLVTDAQYHEPTKSGAKVADIVARLAQENVLLNVFTRQEFAADYAALVGHSGNVEAIEAFGEVLSEGRILED